MSDYTDFIEHVKMEEDYAYPCASEATGTTGSAAPFAAVDAAIQRPTRVVLSGANCGLYTSADVDLAIMELQVRAAGLFPDAPYLQAQWIKAVLYLRSNGKWICDPNAPRPKWGAGERDAKVAA